MSLRMLNFPPLVAVAGTAIIAATPFVSVAGASTAALQAANVLAFATNVTAVSIPGRMDGTAQLRGNDSDNIMTENDIQEKSGDNIVQASRDRTLVAPAGWAFSIWGPIYLGEAALVAATFTNPTIMATMPEWTVPFCAANLTQSLWCASFRPKYAHGWRKYVSVAMLGGTAVSLAQLPFATLLETTSSSSPYWIPVAMHFGWTTAATLVNLNGSLAMNDNLSERAMISAGHASSVVATALGMGVTLSYGLPTYGLTIAWALAACANGMRVKPEDDKVSAALKTGAKVQKVLLTAGSLLSAGASIYTLVV